MSAFEIFVYDLRVVGHEAGIVIGWCAFLGGLLFAGQMLRRVYRLQPVATVVVGAFVIAVLGAKFVQFLPVVLLMVCPSVALAGLVGGAAIYGVKAFRGRKSEDIVRFAAALSMLLIFWITRSGMEHFVFPFRE